MNRILWFSIVLNMAFVGIEAFIGWRNGAMSLLSDAGHNLSDVFSLVLVLIGFRLARVRKGMAYTYGLKKATILISLLNAVLLIVAMAFIWMESINKVMHPVAVSGSAITWTALAGIIVNGLTTLLLMRGQRSDLNVRGAYLHMLADTLVSAGVVVSGIIIMFTDWYVTDPIMSLTISIAILTSSWSLFRASLKLLLDGTPEGVDVRELIGLMYEDDRVSEVHHVHVWAISTTENALTAHVVIKDLGQMEDVKRTLKARLHERGIGHATIEIETVGTDCDESSCKD